MESLSQNGRSARARGASMVEFALLTAALVIACAAGFRAVGHGVARATADGTSVLEAGDRETRVAHLRSAPRR